MASSPTLCANAVQALVRYIINCILIAIVVCLYSLIHPLRYCADYRPFFTIHDTEFKHYTTKTQAP